jgi:hypothetical protein
MAARETRSSGEKKVIEALGRLLADSYTLYLKTHNFHWNVRGPMFTTLHTLFEQEYTERRRTARRTRTFSLAFRTLSVPEMAARLEATGFRVTALLGDYDGGPWDPRAEVWILLAARR